MFRPLRPLYVTESVDRVKTELAGSTTVSIAVLIELAFDQSEAIRLRVAENPRAPAELLACMVHDASLAVRTTRAVRTAVQLKACANSLKPDMMRFSA